MTAGLSACSSSSDTADSGSGSGGSTTIDVWLMRDSVSAQFQNEFVKGFESTHPDIKVKVQIQEWDGIGEKVTAALASNDAPDVIETGNTQVAQFAQSGGCSTSATRWTTSTARPGSRASPNPAPTTASSTASRTTPPTASSSTAPTSSSRFKHRRVRDQDARPVDRGHEEAQLRLSTQGIYLPGQSWYALAGFVWDEGGDLATQSGGKWKGALDTPEAIAGMRFYEQLQALGKGPKDSDEANPPQADVMAKGKVAQVISTPGGANVVVQDNPALKGKLGFFPIPGKTAATPGAVFTGAPTWSSPPRPRSRARPTPSSRNSPATPGRRSSRSR